MIELLLWIGAWAFGGGAAILVVVLLWKTVRLGTRHRTKSTGLGPTRIAQEFLQAQARLFRLKRGAPSPAEVPPAARGPERRLRHGLQSTIARLRNVGSWLGWPSIALILMVISGLLGGLLWELRRQLPLPPSAQQVQVSYIGGLARQSSFRMPESISAARSFYQRELPQRGWLYCGTQATPRCSNLTAAGAEAEIDVYRRVDDQDYSGVTIEVWPQRTPDGETFVIVFEVQP